ncbi:DNA internalization-related competence protein ComEC/Rec2 [Methylogaea oryzae]|uniref:DNA internalization-related competence protein ComEC/Rec2 n=1 Tax=Methylogaea oryzae TaxID=1295382 RepID=A0A8D4VQZ1_9GAMM|nr:DNA internalization-related competence protein ComEC/Rec2 [Methylogaea oryzae]BBL71642.1 DNA internalization-related competence protein ComEC/Rec2 [Methylogaea oryzae]
MHNRIWPALAFVAGVSLPQQWAALPGWPWIVSAWLAFALLAGRRRVVAAALVLGMAWALSFAAWRLQERLPDRLEGEDLAVVGVIADLPERFAHGWRFDFSPEPAAGLPGRLRLSWYDQHPLPKAGETWRLTLRLKRPRGTFNPGGFDYERWLFAQGVGATGYVRPSPDNRRLAEGGAFDFQVWRQRLADNVDAVLSGKPFAGMVRALVMGDESGISQAQWRVLRATGTAHLVAISGSHIGLVAGLVFWLVSKAAARLGLQRWSPPSVGAVAALLAALGYTALADFAIPARRALVMAAVALCAVPWRRHVRLSDVFASALFLVVLLDPFAVLAPGFWLSFAAVALILLAVAGRLRPAAGWRGFLRANWATGLGLAPLLVLLFQQAPWVSPLANLIAIPVMGTLAVPLSLAGAAALELGLDSSGWLLQGADQLLQWCWLPLQWLADWPRVDWGRPAPPGWSLALAGLAAVLCLMPRGLPGRWLAVPLVLPAVVWQPPMPEEGGFRLTALDVGQGLAVVVRTASHTLVYDAGPRFGADVDSGRSVVEPFLRATVGPAIDALVVSHGDNDHIGGADYLLEALPVARLYTSVPERLERYGPIPCRAGQRWRWDGVDFAVLSPWDESGSENNRSCVLKVSGAHGGALLTGDIERETEARLVEAYGAQLASDALVVPHHGSRTSSTEDFVRAVAPRRALIPAGYRNRFKFPSREVAERYRRFGVATAITGVGGALTVDFQFQGLALEQYRDSAGRYWNWRP